VLLQRIRALQRRTDTSSAPVGVTEHLGVCIDVPIKSLRRKFGNDGELVETVRGVGYRFRED
jgi:DNA-binding winged helix-turn-helix (wHTH) protein